MKVEEKLKEDIRYWEDQERDASEILRYASVVLPRLRESLLEIERRGQAAALALQEVALPPLRVTETENEALPAQPANGAQRLMGDCGEQILQALAISRGEFIANELVEYLRDHGTVFSRGAVDYQLRALHAQGKIRQKKPDRRGLKAVWAYCLPEDDLSTPGDADDRALIG
jgi:hypothetical protein